MKNLVFLFFTAFCCTVQTTYCQYDFIELMPSVKSIEEKTYSTEGNEKKIVISNYDKEGRLVSRKVSWKEHDFEQMFEYSYPKKNILVEKQYKMVENKKVNTLTFEKTMLIDQGKEKRMGMNIQAGPDDMGFGDISSVEETSSIPFDSITLKMKNKLKEPKSFDRLVITKTYDEMPGTETKFVYEWSSEKKLYELVRLIGFSPLENDLLSKTEYSHNVDFEPATLFEEQSEVINKKGEIVSLGLYHSFRYKYDERGNWIEMQTFQYSRIGDKTIRKIQYKE
jgi:hypothetical protein